MTGNNTKILVDGIGGFFCFSEGVPAWSLQHTDKQLGSWTEYAASTAEVGPLVPGCGEARVSWACKVTAATVEHFKSQVPLCEFTLVSSSVRLGGVSCHTRSATKRHLQSNDEQKVLRVRGFIKTLVLQIFLTVCSSIPKEHYSLLNGGLIALWFPKRTAILLEGLCIED